VSRPFFCENEVMKEIETPEASSRFFKFIYWRVSNSGIAGRVGG
jgi:hypothetical protein